MDWQRYLPKPPKGRPGEIATLLFGLGTVIILVGLIDIVLRKLGLPRDIALYLSIVLLALIASAAIRWYIHRAKPSVPETTNDDVEKVGRQ
jgi:hypothetical protein